MEQMVEHHRQQIRIGEPFYACVDHPYVEWYSDLNGRVILELERYQVHAEDSEVPPGSRRDIRDLIERRRIRSTFLADLHPA